MKDSESEDNMEIYTILEVSFGDERTPACLMDRRRNQENSLRDIKFGCSGKDLKTSGVQDELKPSVGVNLWQENSGRRKCT